MPQPARNNFSVIGRSLMISAATMFLMAFLIGRGTLGVDESARPLVAGGLVVVGLLDIGIGLLLHAQGTRGVTQTPDSTRAGRVVEPYMFDKLHEECGVFGIFGHPEAANLAYLGLYALQHRGQESAGIASADGVRVRLHRGMGYVADVFDEGVLSTLPGHAAVGHVRYSTAGDSDHLNAQPLLIDCAHGQVAICHNGNLVNAGEIRNELVRQGAIFQTTSDTEVILHLYARSQARPAEEAIIESLVQVTGAYSLVVVTPDRMVAARDPHGFRPLALGRLGDRWIVCSETCAMDLIGATYERDVRPG